MFLAKITDDAAQDHDALEQLHVSLAALAAGIDARFVDAGTALSGAYAVVETLIAALEGVAGALEPAQADAAVATMRGVADELIRLPALQAARAADLRQVAQAGEALRQHIAQIRKMLQYLRIYGLNIKIVAAGAELFAGFADSMFLRLDIGDRQLVAFEGEVKALVQRLPEGMRVEALLGDECAKVIPQVPTRLAEDAAALRAHQAELAGVAARIAEVARAIREKVAAALGALQIGDITRQRLEHVAEAIGMVRGVVQDLGRDDPLAASAVEGRAVALLAAQAGDAVRDFTQEARSLTRNLRGLMPDADRLLSLQGAGGLRRGDDGAPFLSVLEQGIAEVARVTARLGEASGHARRISEATSQTVESLVERLEAVRTVQSDVQQMALNTGLRCTRMGQDGKALAVIAVEIRTYAAALDASATRAEQTLEGLGAVAGSIRARCEAEGARDVGAALSGAVVCIRAGSEAMAAGFAGLGDEAGRVVTMLGETVGQVDCEAEIGQALGEAALQLAALAGDDAPLPAAAEAPARAVIDRIAALYSMARERDLHRGFMAAHWPGSVAAPAADAVAGGDDDLPEDALF